MSSVAARGEVVKLARQLGDDPERLMGLAEAEARDLAAVRHAATRSLYAQHRDVFRRIATAGSLLPAAIAARIATSALGPLISGRVASEVEPQRAVDMAEHMDDAFLAEVCVHLDPDQSAPTIQAFDHDRARGVTRELVERDEHLTLAHLLDAVEDHTVRAVLPVIEDEADLLEAALYVEDRGRLEAVLAMLDDQRVENLIRAAVDFDHRDEALVMLAQLDETTRARFREQALNVELDDPERAQLDAALHGEVSAP